MAGRPVEIAKGIRLWSAKGGLHVGQAFAMWMIPGYLLYRFNTSEAVRGDVEAELPKRPDLPMGGNASNRVTKTTAEQNLNAMLAKVQRGERLELQTPHDVPEEVRRKSGKSQHPLARVGDNWKV